MGVKQMRLKVVRVEFHAKHWGEHGKYSIDVLLIVRLRKGVDWHVEVGYDFRDKLPERGSLTGWRQGIIKATAPTGDVLVKFDSSVRGRRYLILSDDDTLPWVDRAVAAGFQMSCKGEAEEMVRKAKEAARVAEVAQAATATVV